MKMTGCLRVMSKRTARKLSSCAGSAAESGREASDAVGDVMGAMGEARAGGSACAMGRPDQQNFV
jgi:hypothetical protein